jgi:hypothetical protein
MSKEQFEPELARHLAPVKAPEELWARIQSVRFTSTEPSPVRRPPVSRAGWIWAAGAVALVALGAGLTVWMNRDLSSEERAVRALVRAPEELQFHSTDPAALRAWLKTGTGLDVPIPAHTAPAVHVVGASVSRSKGAPTAEISYRVGNVDAALVVSKIPMEGNGMHTFHKGGSRNGTKFQSWTMRGQMYTIAAADTTVGCLLCHGTGAPRTAL